MAAGIRTKDSADDGFAVRLVPDLEQHKAKIARDAEVYGIGGRLEAEIVRAIEVLAGLGFRREQVDEFIEESTFNAWARADAFGDEPAT